ncbi:CxxxxCH/CxxCH domain c-type cytochrome [Anaeromyxobacter diazotrophicus]|uniref:Cytochrome C family protein n=1 Tax=Anaeromyxobacter diazotrophicus TaxID=2590199 RepID=A0A7I9VKY8_9BACT|nr:CxxxxCH/CxxCH domain-containing protein [Anaeromyxobacter diazotrophicus]GEJ57084.1 hypothetical protein AMYX_18250 [Anaeromyxobacter diazotrophicus]
MTRTTRWSATLAAAAGLSLLVAGCGGSADGATWQRRVVSKRPAATATQCTPTGAHAKHDASGIACAVCHPCGGVLAFNGYTYTGGTSATGTLTPGSGTTPTTCGVGCHSPLGAPAHTVAWNQGTLNCTDCHTLTALPATHPALGIANPTRDDCQICHDVTKHTQGTVKFISHATSWMDQADPGFHAFSADKSLATCQACHGQDLKGGSVGVACGQCHDQALPAGVTTWSQNCVMCHGGTDNQTGAPPRATWGQASDPVRVGAHSAHLAPTAISPGFGCVVCHVKPADAFAAGHIDGPTATVTFGGTAVGDTPPAAWNRAAPTCSGTYCHGNMRNGNTANAPDWTKVGQQQAACGTCHGIPPPAPHPKSGSSLTVCSICHDKTMNPDGTMIPPSNGGLHLDGAIEASGHDPSWIDPTSPDFHAFTAVRGLSSCKTCHGALLDGGVSGVACADCHNGSRASNFATCIGCHGGDANATGAPPRTIWGQGNDLIRVGAHTKHVGSTLATPFDCAVCHVTPTDMFSPGHIDGPYATVTFGGVATKGFAPPAYSRPNGATCASTYCHGGFKGTYTYTSWDWSLDQPVYVTVSYAGKNATPAWTDGPMTCGSCHGNPPRTGYWHSGNHGGGNQCQVCHPDATGTTAGVGTGISNPALHVNGAVDVAPRWGSSCFGCH